MKWNEKLRVRSVVSFLVLGAFLAFSVILFRKVQDSPETLNRGHVLNQKVWQYLKSGKASRAGSAILRGKNPRVNGDIGLLSPVDLDLYSVQVVTPEKSFSLPLGAFRLLPKTMTETEFRCIEGWSEDISYAGAKFSDFMRVYELGRKKDGSLYSFVGLETPDGEYYVSIDMESMLHEQTILTYEMNEGPLSLENGAPMRLIIPVKYGIKSLKRIGKIIFSDVKPPDYWAERGYDWYSGL